MIDIAVVVALTEEFQQLLQLINEDIEPIPDDQLGGYSYRFSIPGKDQSYSCLGVLIGEMGSLRAGTSTSHLIATFAPKSIVMVGIAAAIDKDLKLGDVVSADQVDAYLATTKAVDRKGRGFDLEFRGNAYKTSNHLLQQTIHLPFAFPDDYLKWQHRCREDLELLIPSTDCARLIESGLIRKEPELSAVHLASGPVLSATKDFGEWLKKRDGKLAVLEMEAAGLIAAVHERNSSVETMIIRGISDFGDSRKKEFDQVRDGAIRKYAMRNAVRLFLTLASRDVYRRNKSTSSTPNVMTLKDAKRSNTQTVAELSLTESKMSLKAAYAQKREFALLGRDTVNIENQILQLRRRVRELGLLQSGFFLENGRYELIEELGSGGYGTVWRAYDHIDEIVVAVKCLHDRWARDESKCQRFFRGGRVMWGLNHPHIVRVFQHEGSDPPYLYFVMEYVRFGTLDAAIRTDSVEVRTAFEMLGQVAEALHFAHTQGFVHRDVKPSNILIGEQFQAKLCDFDLVLAEDTTGGTGVGQLGTVAFCAPELFDRPFDADARTDVYSLGRIAIFILQGAENYRWHSLMTNSSDYIRSLNCSEWLKEFINKAVAKHPDSRFKSAQHFAVELKKLISDDHLLKSPSIRPERTFIEQPRPQLSMEGLDDAT